MTIEELYKKVIADEELRKAYAAAAKDGKVAEFLSENGCTSTKEEIKAFFESKKELSDDELDAVSGGDCQVPDSDEAGLIGVILAAR